MLTKNKEELKKAFSDFVENWFGTEGVNKTPQTTEVKKSVDEDKRLFTAVVLRPNKVDSHGDIYDEETVSQACYDYVSKCMNQNLQHAIDVEKEQVEVVESYIAPADFELDRGEVMKGDWVMTVKVHNDTIWEMCKKGDFTGFSVGCMSLTQDIKDDE